MIIALSVLTALAAQVEDAGAAEEPTVPVAVVNTLTAEARLDNGNRNDDDDNFGVFLNRLNLSANTESVALSARIDSMVIAEPPGEGYSNDVRVERISAELNLGTTTLLAGDFYKQLGRGIILSLRKVDEVGVDLTMRGAEARWAPEGHQLAAFAGVVNTANFDTPSARFVKDTGDLLAGASYELGAFDGVTVGLHGLYAQPAERLLDELDYSISGGATLELPELIEGLSFYTEVAIQNRRLAGLEELGTAAYFTTDLILGDLSFLVEAMRLGDFQQRGSRNSALGSTFDYNIPPTLERIDQEVLSQIDVTGARLRAELALFEGALITHANGMFRVNNAGKPDELQQIHGYGGAELRFDDRASKAAISGGYRDERTALAPLKSMVHFEVDLVKALGDGWALHLASTNELRTLEDRDYARGSTYAGAESAGNGSLTFEVGYDTQDPTPDVRSVFFAGILVFQLGDVVHVRTNAGTQRGGLKCVAGVCREFPPFAGVRSEIVIRL